jgi:hypothetical protein
MDWTVTGDGLLALAGGILAFFAIVLQTRHADKGLQRQIDEVRKREDKRAGEVARSTAAGLLMEIDWFYRHYLRDALDSLRSLDPQKGPPAGPRFRFDPFPVFSGDGAPWRFSARDMHGNPKLL